MRDALVELVSQSHRVHVLIGELEAPVQVAELAVAELINSSEAEGDQNEEMVTKRAMTDDQFLLGSATIGTPRKKPYSPSFSFPWPLSEETAYC